jgi:transketolase
VSITERKVAPDLGDLREMADRIRRHIVDMCAGSEGGHFGGSMSITDILAVLYGSVLRIDPDSPQDPDRDVLVLSKGHGALALYAALAERGFMPVAELACYGQPDSRLMGHPLPSVPGVEMPTGSLGHGLALGLGFALAGRLAGNARRAFVITGDGELQEGSCWETASCAAALEADNLTAVVDRNCLQLTGETEDIAPLEPLADRWRAFGWSVRQVDGHDLGELEQALSSVPWEPGKPSAVVAMTEKGHGVPFIAGKTASHYVKLTERSHAKTKAALGAFTRKKQAP